MLRSYARLCALPLLFILNCSSCVTIWGTKDKDVHIHAAAGSHVTIDTACKALILDSSRSSPNELYIHVLRGKLKLLVNVQEDTLVKHFSIRPRLSFLYYENIFSGPGFVGLAVDDFTPKRFDFPSEIYLYPHQKHYRKYAYPLHKKEGYSINLSLPYVNGFYVQDKKTSQSNVGFFGGSIGGNYRYQAKRFISLQAGAVTNFELPIPAPLDRFGDTVKQTKINSIFINIRDNRSIGRFDFGYGLHMSWYSWNRYTTYRKENRTDTTFHYYAASGGLALSSYYRLGRNIHVGVLYQPGFISFLPHDTQFLYTHTILGCVVAFFCCRVIFLLLFPLSPKYPILISLHSRLKHALQTTHPNKTTTTSFRPYHDRGGAGDRHGYLPGAFRGGHQGAGACYLLHGMGNGCYREFHRRYHLCRDRLAVPCCWWVL